MVEKEEDVERAEHKWVLKIKVFFAGFAHCCKANYGGDRQREEGKDGGDK